MILPEKKTNKSKYTIASSVTIAMSLLTLTMLIVANVPEADPNRDLVRELREFNIVRLLPEVEEPEPEPELEEEEIIEEEPTPPPPPLTPPAEEVVEEVVVEEAVERLDLGDLLPEGLQVDLSTENRGSERAVASNPSAASEKPQQRLRLDESAMGQVGGLNTLRDRTVGARTAAKRTPASEETTPAIDVEQSAEANIGTSIEVNRNTNEGIQGRASLADVLIADMIDVGDFMSDAGAMNTVYESLSVWMAENTKEIPQSVNRIFTDGDRSGNHQTTTANFTINDRVFDLIIMNKTETNEIHVLLVEGTEATYLIDKNFSMQSNFLRRGSVTKRDNRIVDFGSSLRPANDQQTNEFYQIFLSWWNSVREDA